MTFLGDSGTDSTVGAVGSGEIEESYVKRLLATGAVFVVPVTAVDEQTKSTWNILGEAVDGPLKGTELVEVPNLDIFWFAWFSYSPGTYLVDG